MTLRFAYPERVPLPAVQRLLNNFMAFVEEIRTALESKEFSSAGTNQWQRALTLLQKEGVALKAEAAMFEAGDYEPLLNHAAELRLLTRRMDGYNVALAGNASAQSLTLKRQLLVLTAWQIAAAASGSEAAGL